MAQRHNTSPRDFHVLDILFGRQHWQLDSEAVLAGKLRAARASEQLHITSRRVHTR